MSDKFSVGDIPLDAMQTIRKAWVDPRDAHRVIPLPPEYNRTLPEYNADCTPSCISYYYDNIAEVTEITCLADVASNLDTKIIDLYSGLDDNLYKLYYIVDNSGVPPIDSGIIKYVPIHINSNDFKEVVALSTKNAIETHINASEDFSVVVLPLGKLKITNIDKGITADASDVSTGFSVLTTIQGNTELVDKIYFTYDSNGNLILVESESGENIVGYELTDIRSLCAKRDSVAVEDPDNGNHIKVGPDGQVYVDIISVSSDVNGINTYSEISSVAAGTETTIVTYTASVGKVSRLQRVTFSGSNIGEYKIKVNGSIVEKQRTYFGDGLNDEVIFDGADIAGLNLTVGDIVTVTVKHNRPMVGDFNSRIQVMEIG